MTALAQPVAIRTPNTRELLADDSDTYPIGTNNFATLYVRIDPDNSNKIQFSPNNSDPWYHSLSWTCGTEYALFITFNLPSGVELGVTSTTGQPWPWFSQVTGTTQYICVPWSTSVTAYHFRDISNPDSVDPKIVVTPA